ncbi:hypothetical protein Y032_0007g3439 [Ancylostoma ceylanicum]|uniref:Uncharacterized protein n=1 Tax=Ancylostoma ceylanicum TaxID=53326 RepID=A0A016VP24_9BILA|nr:hypothetical protein Y032_0007g3439 [Ancylostoma ceylanicum]
MDNYKKLRYAIASTILSIFQQWFEGRRRIEHISLVETQILSRNEVLDSIDPARILPWSEVLRIFSPTMREQWEHSTGGFHVGIRNRAAPVKYFSVSRPSI